MDIISSYCLIRESWEQRYLILHIKNYKRTMHFLGVFFKKIDKLDKKIFRYRKIQFWDILCTYVRTLYWMIEAK